MHPPADVPVFMRLVRLQVLEGVCQSFMPGAMAATGEYADMDAFPGGTCENPLLAGFDHLLS